MMYRIQREHDSAPPAIPGCERVRRVWDPRYHRWAARILPGEIFVTRHDEFITTVLGSCIAVCVRDPVLRVGGMSLFMLPPRTVPEGGEPRSDAGEEVPHNGRFELERLIDQVLEAGADRTRLKAKMFGGGRSLAGVAEAAAKTIAFVRQFLRQQGLPLVEEKLGDSHPRRVMYFPNTGTALVERLPPRFAARVANRETHYLDRLVRESVS
jgi:chemotaxis protein CheD